MNVHTWAHSSTKASSKPFTTDTDHLQAIDSMQPGNMVSLYMAVSARCLVVSGEVSKSPLVDG